MAMLTISVPDDVLRTARERVGEARVEEYLVTFIHSLALEGLPIDAETEQALLEGLDSPLEDMTDADWDALRERARRKPGT